MKISARLLWMTAACLALSGGAATALELAMPQGMVAVSERDSALDSHALPVGSFDGSAVPVESVEGAVSRRTWRMSGGTATTLQILEPLRNQLKEVGYEILFECQVRDCGGFDFRFGIEVVPAPDMQVDLSDFRFLSAKRGLDHHISLLVTRSNSAAYVQMIAVSPPGDVGLEVSTPVAPDPTPEPVKQSGLSEQLLETGHVVLSDLNFATGADALLDGEYESLAQLAGFLAEHEKARIALVGHTDSVGELDRNIDLSKRRAQAVRDKLSKAYEVDAARIQAEGMGYLSPLATNLTPEGREANRRVEVVLLSN